jgi:hypothetical protein
MVLTDKYVDVTGMARKLVSEILKMVLSDKYCVITQADKKEI